MPNYWDTKFDPKTLSMIPAPVWDALNDLHRQALDAETKWINVKTLPPPEPPDRLDTEFFIVRASAFGSMTFEAQYLGGGRWFASFNQEEITTVTHYRRFPEWHDEHEQEIET
jgi:hypothetical protein